MARYNKSPLSAHPPRPKTATLHEDLRLPGPKTSTTDPGRIEGRPVNSWLYLGGAISLEIIATSALKAAEGFSRPLPTTIVILAYVGAFYCLSVALRTIPMGVAYAIWSGIGIVVISVVGLFAYKQRLDLPALIGIALILIGTVVINLYSKATH
ncbi:DMT family transporter [Sphingomonas sp. ID0503]|uniref:DMT family transporter n=1 Tax=Sphingomonas sp. ID0503 TaxID=3399691 RepID=UPI003AFB5F3B